MAFVAIVDDEKNILTSLSLALEKEGHIVAAYSHPVVALPKVIFVPPDLLILNGRMPGMHGIEFFLKFREFSRAPVIFLSASAVEIQAELERIGIAANDYVETPFSTRDMMRRVAHILASCRVPG